MGQLDLKIMSRVAERAVLTFMFQYQQDYGASLSDRYKDAVGQIFILRRSRMLGGLESIGVRVIMPIYGKERRFGAYGGMELSEACARGVCESLMLEVSSRGDFVRRAGIVSEM
jgi:hypothetical protein